MKFNRTTNERYNHPGKTDAENNLLYEIRMGDTGDPWGLSMGWLFAIADYLSEWGEVPAEWGYRQGYGGIDESAYELEAIRELASDDWQSVLSVGNTLHRWTEKLREQGKDY